VGTALMGRIAPLTLLVAFGAINAALTLAAVVVGGYAGVAALTLTSFFMSIMFPTIFALGIERLGPLTNKASSLLIMAIVGGALVPYLQGVLADHIGLQPSFILPLVCYGYVIFFGLVGARLPADTTRGG
jgi:FHS family L-fucose permease-like MFS transporter